jgi:tetratricopeptide (TPR) repeat protein
MFRKFTARWILIAGIMLGVPSVLNIIQPQVLMAQVNPADRIKLLYEQAFSLTQKGEFAQAEPLYQQALLILNQEFRKLNPTQQQEIQSSVRILVALAGMNRGLLYASTGQHKEAITLLQDNLKLLEQSMGRNHPDVIKIRESVENYTQQHNQISQKISPPETEGLELLSRSCRNAVLELDQQVARWIEENIKQWTPAERREADLDAIRRRYIYVGKIRSTTGSFSLHLSNSVAIFSPPSDRATPDKTYVKISQSLASACPEVDEFSFKGAGSGAYWTMRRTNFSVVYGLYVVTLDNNALVGLEKCQGCELDSFISYFKPNITDDKIRALLPRDDVTTFDAKGKFLGLPVVAILTKGCQQIRHPDGGISCRYDPVRGVVFNTPFTKARDHLAQRYNLGAFKAKLLPDPTSKSRSILICSPAR